MKKVNINPSENTQTFIGDLILSYQVSPSLKWPDTSVSV